jgi:hypothetical protein
MRESIYATGVQTRYSELDLLQSFFPGAVNIKPDVLRNNASKRGDGGNNPGGLKLVSKEAGCHLIHGIIRGNSSGTGRSARFCRRSLTACREATRA